MMTSNREAAERIAAEIAFAMNRSHCTGEPLHAVCRALLDDASELSDIVEEFVTIVAPLIERELVQATHSSDDRATPW